MEIYTIGFTKKSAEEFFEKLRRNSIEQLVDVRLNNTSQLAGFAKRRDLTYFLKELVGVAYHHERLLAPSKELLKGYRSKRIEWDQYEAEFMKLMSERRVENEISSDLFSTRTILLCSEPTANNCHRRLVIDYLRRCWGNIQAVHL